jgi:mRNA interferase HigB
VGVIGLKPLREFWERHPDAERPLRLWYGAARRAHWTSLQDVRRPHPHADAVRTRGGGTLSMFDVMGNKYRLIVRARYDYQLINVRRVLTHEQYSRGAWKE